MNNRLILEQLKEKVASLSSEVDNSVKNDINMLIEKMEYSAQFKRYGLVFEEELEEVEELLHSHKISPTQVDDKNILMDESKPVNMLLEGDNYVSLKQLEKTHLGKVDVIYIDPPYNTGNKDFIYNDSYVNDEDAFRHSKWLSFMHKRLQVARKLLSEDGVIFISIDDNEQAQLKLLCDSIFGERNFVANFIWQNKYTVSNDKLTGVTSQTEYILCYAKTANNVQLNPDSLREEYVKKAYRNPDNDSRGLWRSVQLYKKKNPTSYEVTSPTGKTWNLPWNYNKVGWERLVAEDLIYWGKDGNAQPQKKVFLNDSKGTSQRNLLLGADVGYTGDGGNEVEEIFGDRNAFTYPKPTKLIEKILRISTKPDSVVLDFFAGSGTTGHAVMSLNEEDGGSRQFILATNNENNIAEDVTYERIKRVINGYTTPKGVEVDGMPNNLKYIRLDTVKDTPVSFGSTSVKDLLFIVEDVMEDLESDYYRGISPDKVVYLVGDVEEAEELLSVLDVAATEKEIKIFSVMTTVNHFSDTEYSKYFYNLPNI